MTERRVLILGAAGRDFHNFNVLYRDDPTFRVVGFTATQIPNIADRSYPPGLAGSRYPDGVPIFPEEELEDVVRSHDVDLVVFSYSDVSHGQVMHLAARAVAAGADFTLPGVSTMLPSSKPVISVTAVRTGAGKSQTSRKIRGLLADRGLDVAAVRHPMPYGDLARQRVQRFASFEDLLAAEVTLEEREEYEPYLREGAVVFAGADYQAILEAAEAEANVIIWDGGNNDLPFFRPDLAICIVDPFRVGHESGFWPGEANLRMADVVIINKIDTALAADVDALRENVALLAPSAVVVEAASPIRLEDASVVWDKRVLVIDDGPTITHGQMPFGAGYLAAQEHGAAEIVDPREFAVGSIAAVFEQYDHIGAVLPAMGYGDDQRRELEMTITAAAPDAVVIGTPIDLAEVIAIDVPSTRVFYDLDERVGPTLDDTLDEFLAHS